MEILSTEVISPTQTLQHLSDREELNDRQRNTLEYLQKHVRVKDPGTVEELQQELAELDAFKDDHILKIIEILPRTEEEVRTLFSKERIKLEDEDIDSVIAFSESVSE